MRSLAFACALICSFAAAGWAQTDAESDQVKAGIAAQIRAFQADDFETAFTFASPMIRDLFQSPGNFGAMVRNGYPMVWRPRAVEYLGSRKEAGRLWQNVQIMDAHGRIFVLEYQMVEMENGWKINGVTILVAAELSV